MELQEEFEDYLQKMNAFRQQKDTLSSSFCTLSEKLSTFPEKEISTQDIEQKVSSLFKDVNQQIDLYDRQFKILEEELGVLCQPPPSPIPVQFFEGLFSLFRLAYGTYKDHEDLAHFLPPLQTIVSLLESGVLKLQGDLLEQALLLQLIKSAWAFTKTTKSQEQVANQLKKQGGARNRTRKQKRNT